VEGRKTEKLFLFPMKEMGAKTPPSIFGAKAYLSSRKRNLIGK
jgi:hypothetical protein